jgi:hypothetical protein
LKLILEPIFEADFQLASFGYRPKKAAHAAIQRVSKAILEGKTYVIGVGGRPEHLPDGMLSHEVPLASICRQISSTIRHRVA